MAYLSLRNTNGSVLGSAFRDIATKGAETGQPEERTYLSYGRYDGRRDVYGTDFTFDTMGRLSGGTITAIDYVFAVKGDPNPARVVTLTGLSLPVSLAVSFGTYNADGLSTLLVGNDTIAVDATEAKGFTGDDNFILLGAGSSYSFTTGNGTTRNTANTIDGGPGFNTVAFPYALRSEATIGGGGGNEAVYQSGVTSTLTAIDELRFLDGTVYEDNNGPGAQAALEFLGIFGRLPDAINAGGYGSLAQQSGTAAAARAMLGTGEARAATGGLDNTGFTARLYRTMLGRDGSTLDIANWRSQLDSGTLDRATMTGLFASTIEAQRVNATTFASGAVFAADPAAVEVLRAYEALLGRAPEPTAISGNLGRLRNGSDALATFYREIQGSAEFKAAANPYGLTATSSFAAIRGVVLSDPFTATITPLVTSNGIAVTR